MQNMQRYKTHNCLCNFCSWDQGLYAASWLCLYIVSTIATTLKWRRVAASDWRVVTDSATSGNQYSASPAQHWTLIPGVTSRWLFVCHSPTHLYAIVKGRAVAKSHAIIPRERTYLLPELFSCLIFFKWKLLVWRNCDQVKSRDCLLPQISECFVHPFDVC
jgi:hypothetical protein